jgi:predicted nucleic acid-binding protein
MIAGIALARRSALATGNTRHFDDAGIAVVDPWESEPT